MPVRPTIQPRVLAAALALLLSAPAVAQEWYWDAYGTDAYDGSVTLHDDLGTFNAAVDPTVPSFPAVSASTQPPVVVIQQSTTSSSTVSLYWEDRWW